MKPENVKCPNCDGPMISRSSKYGVFWGCAQYPKCKGTRDSLGRSRADREAEGEKPRYYESDREDRLVLDNLMKEVDAHDLKEGQKFSFNKSKK